MLQFSVSFDALIPGYNLHSFYWEQIWWKWDVCEAASKIHIKQISPWVVDYFGMLEPFCWSIKNIFCLSSVLLYLAYLSFPSAV